MVPIRVNKGKMVPAPKFSEPQISKKKKNSKPSVFAGVYVIRIRIRELFSLSLQFSEISLVKF